MSIMGTVEVPPRQTLPRLGRVDVAHFPNPTGRGCWSPAFRRPACDGWQSQCLNRPKAGLQPRQLGLPDHHAELTSGLFLARRRRNQK